jgi:hypothetical protein
MSTSQCAQCKDKHCDLGHALQIDLVGLRVDHVPQKVSENMKFTHKYVHHTAFYQQRHEPLGKDESTFLDRISKTAKLSKPKGTLHLLCFQDIRALSTVGKNVLKDIFLEQLSTVIENKEKDQFDFVMEVLQKLDYEVDLTSEFFNYLRQKKIEEGQFLFQYVRPKLDLIDCQDFILLLRRLPMQDLKTLSKFVEDKRDWINATDSKGWAALHYAAKSKQRTRFLLERGASPVVLTKDFRIPLDVARIQENPNEIVIDMLEEAYALIEHHVQSTCPKAITERFYYDDIDIIVG